MNWRRIFTIYNKDMRDAIRDARVLMALLVPLAIGIFYNVTIHDDDTQLQVTIVYAAPEPTELPARLVEFAGDSISLTFEHVSTGVEVEQRLATDEADLGLVFPTGFDGAVRRGETPALTIVQPASPTIGGDYAATTIEPALRRMAGQGPPAVITVEATSKPNESVSAVDAIGMRTWSILSAIVLMIAMISMLAIPVVLAEEAEKKTLDALVLIASYAEVIVAKALLGVTYVAIMVPLLLGITGTVPERWPLFVFTVALLALSLIGFGLLMAGFFKNATQLNNWSGVLLVPLITPAFIVGLPAPGSLQKVAEALPTGAAARLLINSATDERVFGNQILSMTVIAAWTALAFGLLLWQLARRQA